MVCGACSTTIENPVAPKPEAKSTQPADSLESNQLVDEPDGDTLITGIDRIKGSIDVQLNHFVLSVSKQYKVLEDTKPHLLDRFDADIKVKTALQKKFEVPYGKSVNVFPIAHLSAYEFPSEAAFENVLENWFNCFESDCDQVVAGKESGPLKTPPAFAIILPKSRQIIYLHYACEHEGNDWKRFKGWLKTAFADADSYGFELDCGGKIKWFGKIE
jgi:hypothetical protein